MNSPIPRVDMVNSCWPEPDALVGLHQRLLRDDPLAPLDFASAVLRPLVNDLRAANPHADEHLRLTAAEDAVLVVIRNPSCYDPDRCGLRGYLGMVALGDLRNALKKEQRHQDKRDPEIPVEVVADDRNDPVEDDLPSFDDPQLAAVIARLTDTERQVLHLMRDGERDTEVYAALLGITDRPVEERRSEVKRVKERLFKRLKRAVGES